MDLQYLCTNCLTGTVRNGTCTYCHKSVNEASKQPANALPVRYMLGSQYYLGKVIGNGGFGITYLAWDCIEQRRVIVKELYPRQDVQRDPASKMVVPLKGQEDYFRKLKHRFKEEAQILYSFRHEPSVMNVYRLMEDNNTVYYSMEYLSGFDLKTYMEQQGKLGWPQLSGYIRKILYTLHILHGQNLIHRDISPDNIFLTSVTDAKLIDFGSVRNYNSGQGLTTILKQVYAPVEQYFTNGDQGPWTDIYALSVTMYHALSGSRPPRATDRAVRDGAIQIGRLCPELPEHVARAITRGMEVRAENRFQSVEEMAEALFPGEKLFVSEKQYVTGRHREEEKPDEGAPAGNEPGTHSCTIRCTAGAFSGRRIGISPGDSVSFGRDRQCSVNYPVDSPGISRRQFCLWCDQYGNLFIQDENSTYGTLVSGYRIEPGKWYKLERGNTIGFAGENYYVE